VTERLIGCRVQFDWDFNGAFTDESANLVRASGETRFAPPEQSISATQGIVDRASIELRSVAGRYSALNTTGALYSLIQNGGAYHVPVTIDTTIDGTTWTRIFTGVTQVPRETGLAHNGMPTVQFECRSRDELLRQKRASSAHADFRARAITGATEAETIAEYLADEGLSGGAVEIDAGLVTIPWAWLDDESPLEDMWQMAAAAGGRLYTDADGVWRYENMAHWLRSPHRTSQQTYTNADWQRLEAWFEDGEIYNTVTVEYAARQIDTETVVWEPDEEVTIPAGGSRTMTANFSHPAYTQPTLNWRASTAGGTDLTASVSITATWYAQRAVLVITNAHATRAAILTPLQILAQPAVGGPTGDETRTSAADGGNSAWFTNRGDRTRSIRGNVYVQSRAQAGMLAQFLLDRHERARLFYRMNGCLGSGVRKPGDRVTINDVSVMSSARAAMVLAVSWRYAGGEHPSYLMDLECMDAANLYPYADASPGYFIISNVNDGSKLDTDGVAPFDTGVGRLFY
jgi:hypothetical protein